MSNNGEERAGRMVTLRSIGIAIALIPASVMWVIQLELVWYSGEPTTVSLFPHVIFVIFLLALLNQLIARLWPGAELTPAETMTVYIMLCLATAMAGHDLIEILVPMLSHATWFATPENGWQTTFMGFMKKWLYVTDREAVRGFYEGNSSMYTWEVLRAWGPPLFLWLTFILALVLSMFGLNILLRKQWTEKERLSYPIIQIPLELATGMKNLLRSKLFWAAFIIAGGIDLINGLSVFWPAIPEIPVVHIVNLGQHLTTAPWNRIGGTPVSLYPFAIGLCFFLPTDLAFSCWFFYIFWKLERVIAPMFTVQQMPGFPFIVEQTAGGYIGLGLIALWVSRHHLKDVIRKILGKPTDVDDSMEALSYRRTATWLGMCWLYLIGFCLVAGMSLWVILLFFLVYFLISVAVARMRAELGPPAHDLHHGGPDQFLSNAFGTRGLGMGNITMFSFFWFFNRAYRGHPMAHSLEGFKIGQLLGMNYRRLLIAMCLAVALGTILAYWAILHVNYKEGASAGMVGPVLIFGQEPWSQLNHWVRNPQDPNIPAVLATGFGLISALFLAAMRMRFTWWPFHPVGFATSASWSMDQLWVPMMVGWLFKWLILRYGGAKAYRPAVPFFIGLVLGDIMVGSFWSLLGAIIKRKIYVFWPY